MKSIPTQIAEKAVQQQIDTQRGAAEVAAFMPRYRDLKVIHAARIIDVSNIAGSESLILQVEVPASEDHAASNQVRVPVDPMFVHRYAPSPGDWYATYGDGFPWVIKQDRFESGYAYVGQTLAEFIRGYCVSNKIEGYTPELSDDELVQMLPPGMMESMCVRFAALKMEAL